MTDTAKADEVARHIPDAVWDVHVWNPGHHIVAGAVDIADRRRIIEHVLTVHAGLTTRTDDDQGDDEVPAPWPEDVDVDFTGTTVEPSPDGAPYRVTAIDPDGTFVIAPACRHVPRNHDTGWPKPDPPKVTIKRLFGQIAMPVINVNLGPGSFGGAGFGGFGGPGPAAGASMAAAVRSAEEEALIARRSRIRQR